MSQLRREWGEIGCFFIIINNTIIILRGGGRGGYVSST